MTPAVRLAALDAMMRDERALAAVPITFGILGAVSSIPRPILHVSLGFFVALLGGLWLVRTWRRLWLPANTPYERVVYATGVRGFGILTTVAIIVSSVVTPALRDGIAGVARDLSVHTMTLPLKLAMGLWMGFWWGRAMAWTLGTSR